MTKPQVTWTGDLAQAAQALSRATYAYETTIPERAREMAFLHPGDVLNPMQLDCVAMLRSRLHERTPAEDAFNLAWGAAWEAAKVQPGDVAGSYDRALKPRAGEVGSR